MNTTLVTDGDILLYRAAAATERGIDWGDGIWTLHGDIDAAKRSIEETLEAKARIVTCRPHHRSPLRPERLVLQARPTAHLQGFPQGYP